jgi:hypothetical protein
MTAGRPSGQVDVIEGVAPSSSLGAAKILQSERPRVMLGDANGPPATRSKSDHRGCWTGALTPVAGSPAVRLHGRFTPQLSRGALLDGVAEVALSSLASDPEQALLLSKSAWDRGRRAQGRLDLPRAEIIRQRFGYNWARVIELSLTPRGERLRLEGQWSSSNARGFGEDGERDAILAIQAAAVAVGHAPTALQYDEVARAREQESRGRWRHAPLSLPRSRYMLEKWSNWRGALQAAGLVAPDPKSFMRRPPIDLVPVLDQLVTELGFTPSNNWFRQWGHRLDIPVGRKNTWGPLVDEVRELRRCRGEAMPGAPTRWTHYLPLPDHLPRIRRPHPHRREEVLESLRRYGAGHLAPGQLPRVRHYRDACRRDLTLIYPSKFHRLGTFHELCHEAGLE